MGSCPPNKGGENQYLKPPPSHWKIITFVEWSDMDRKKHSNGWQSLKELDHHASKARDHCINHWTLFFFGGEVKIHLKIGLWQVPLYYQPQQCTTVQENPQNYHILASTLIHPKNGFHLMTPKNHWTLKTGYFEDPTAEKSVFFSVGLGVFGVFPSSKVLGNLIRGGRRRPLFMNIGLGFSRMCAICCPGRKERKRLGVEWVNGLTQIIASFVLDVSNWHGWFPDDSQLRTIHPSFVSSLSSFCEKPWNT